MMQKFLIIILFGSFSLCAMKAPEAKKEKEKETALKNL